MIPTIQGQVPSFQGRIVEAVRLKNSMNGNPRFRVYFDNKSMILTKTDSAVSYDVENLVSKNVPVHVWLTPSHQIYAMQVV